MKYFSNGMKYLTTPGHKAGHQMELIRPGNSPRHFFGACATSGPLYKQDCIAFDHVVPAHTLALVLNPSHDSFFRVFPGLDGVDSN